MTEKLDGPEDDAMTISQYRGPQALPPDCACGCNRLANPLNADGLSKNCADLAWRNAR